MFGNDLRLIISPNPTYDFITLAYKLTKDGAVSISLIDLNGMQFYSNEIKNQNVGSYEYKMDLTSFPKGTYLCQLITENGKITKKLIKT
jgi:hypothetical protein